MKIKNAADVLREAAEYIGEHGWVQDDLEDDYGKVCAIGAINRVTHSHGYGAGADYAAADDFGALDALSMHIGIDPSWEASQPRTFLHPVARWNDARGRTAEDVILAMKRAAEEIDEIEGK